MIRILLSGFMFLATTHLIAQSNIDSITSARTAEMKKLAVQWSRGGYTNDSAFVAEHSDSPGFRPAIFHQGTFPAFSDKAFLSARRGDVLGPFVSGNRMGIYRFVKSDRRSDSAQVTHIWVADKTSPGRPDGITRTKRQAKQRADSICNEIHSGRVLIENIVESLTDDPGSLTGNKGNYGWFTSESGFVEAFKTAGLTMPVDSTFVIETEFGYHVIQVEARTKEYQCCHAWEIVRTIDSCFGADGVARTFPAQFKGGPAALKLFVQKNALRGESTESDPPNEALVVVWFTVEMDGTLSGIEVQSAEYLDAGLVQESIRIVELLPAWEPAHTCDGPVASRCMLVLFY
ncbi:MAG TPA: peptidylprolyl isomerase [Bacteroidia bacterium]|nr:peptidylprolyl isomerase [Bacteroidia bacterium]